VLKKKGVIFPESLFERPLS